MRIYVAGPMTGIQDFNFPAFHAAAAGLREQGHDVVSPAEINAEADRLHRENLRFAVTEQERQAVQHRHWQACMRRDLAALLTCDAIAMLPGWQRSRGAQAEHFVATLLGLQVLAADAEHAPLALQVAT